jgi:hypothetical protein
VLTGKYEAPGEDSGGQYHGDLEPLDLALLNEDLTDRASNTWKTRGKPSDDRTKPYPRLIG